jgi:carbonic anhydrase/acetyltransferase-like protein (isoleucine patch superfamily)
MLRLPPRGTVRVRSSATILPAPRRRDRVSIDPTAFIHSLAFVCGDVTLGARVSVWPTAVIRGDSAAISIGADSNVQDGAVVHVDVGLPCRIGERVAIGHRAIVHGATVEDDCLIGMGAILLNGVHVGRGSIVGAGAVCPEGMEIPVGSLVLGVPGRVVRPTTDEEIMRIGGTVEAYLLLQREHRDKRYARHHAPYEGSGPPTSAAARGSSSPAPPFDVLPRLGHDACT